MPLRQEVTNVVLAQLLAKRRLVGDPEQILSGPTGRAMPDLLLDLHGLRLWIECEYGKTANSAQAAYDKAKRRVDEGMAHIGVAVVYPKKARTLSLAALPDYLEEAQLRFAIVTEVTAAPSSLPLFPPGVLPEEDLPPFEQGTVDDLADSLRRSYEQLVRDETLHIAVELLDDAIERCVGAFQAQKATTGRLALALEIKDLPRDGNGRRAKEKFIEAQRRAVNRISALIVVNALIFQEVLSGHHPDVRPLQSFRDHDDIVSAIHKHWLLILEINYYPIFHIATELLKCFAADQSVNRAVAGLVDVALRIVTWRAALRHDLAGRIYHQLLEEAKYLGAFFTSIPSATLLLKLALRPDGYALNWADLGSLEGARIADLACGSGTLLMAGADAVADNYVRACAKADVPADVTALHRLLVEKMIWGYDVQQSAVHLTASTLSLRVPDAPVKATHLYHVHLGGYGEPLGSLEFLQGGEAKVTLYSQPQQVTGKESLPVAVARIDPLDLCVMNPPFTRSVGGNLLFGNLDDDERKRLQKKLKRIVRSQEIPANITAGLGSPFMALADRHIKPGGRLAVVLPRALISGVSWKPTRGIIGAGYHLEYLIVSHDPERWNFSENTDLSEVLAIARKCQDGPVTRDARTVCVNLWRQPANAVEALAAARCLLDNHAPDVMTGQGALSVEIRGTKAGEAVTVPWSVLREGLWGFPCAFAQAELIRSLYHLMRGQLYLPGEGAHGTVAICPLGELGTLGYDRRDVHDAFRLATGETDFPTFWGHNGKQVTTLQQTARRWLQARSKAKAGRQLRSATQLWKKAGRLLIVERLRLNTMRLAAVRLDRKVLSNVWWTFALERGLDAAVEKCLALWLNSTLGLLTMMGHREDTEGAWIQFKKPILRQMPVLDPRTLSADQLAALAGAYDDLAKRHLLPFPHLEADEVRAAMDTALSSTLGLPDLAGLRQSLAREPVISLTSARLLSEPGS